MLQPLPDPWGSEFAARALKLSFFDIDHVEYDEDPEQEPLTAHVNMRDGTVLQTKITREQVGKIYDEHYEEIMDQ